MIKAAGVYVVTDSTTKNAYLVSIKGEAPYLKIVSAMNFTEFKDSGRVTSYKATSSILKAIEKDPSQYKFEEISIVPTKIFVNKEIPEEPFENPKVSQEDLVKYINYYKEHGCSETDLLAFVAIQRSSSLSEAQTIVNFIKSVLKHGTGI